MTEEFLYYIWQYRLMDAQKLRSGYSDLEIVHPGIRNTDAGPDFFNARIKLGGTLWAGNVEIHVKSSDWLSHRHHKDEAYNNIILHVVYLHDADIRRQNGEPIPELELRGLFDEKLFVRFQEMESSLDGIPCGRLLRDVNDVVVKNWLSRLFVEKMEEKAAGILGNLDSVMMDWEQVFFEWLAWGFGLKVNAGAMMMVARNTPVKLIARMKGNPFRLEALLLGQAGLLKGKITDEYPGSLKKEYGYLAATHHLNPLPRHIWKYARMRPAGFPDIRLSQFACLLGRTGSVFSCFLSAEHFSDLIFLNDLTASDYWTDHYRIGKKSAPKIKRFGKSSAEKLLMNIVVPFMLLYGKERNMPALVEKAVSWIEHLPPEENNIIRTWKSLGIIPGSALESQALLHLKKQYCDRKRCLNCSIGSAIIRNP
ncbi:MAG: DUF2851 family protein [Bacteroidales bacterium]|nr:DUF2851 family protein [Bacteroidales bacterium]